MIKNKDSDEINLLEIFRKTFSFFQRFCLSVFSFIRKHLLIFISFVLLGIVGGVVHYKFFKPVYLSEVVLSSNYIANDMCADMIQHLQEYIDDDTPELLAKKLDIDIKTAKNISKINFENFYPSLERDDKRKDTIVFGSPFKIKVWVFDYKIFEIIQPKIVNYFDKNPFFISQKNIHFTNTNLLISKIQKNLSELDSLKKTIANHLILRGTQNGFVFGQPLDPLNVYREGINLYKEELSYNADLAVTTTNIRVMSYFEVREKPYRPDMLLSLLYGAIIGLMCGFLAAFIKQQFIRKQHQLSPL
ncbi:MAG: GNVR domain-containing protein [Bacteroidota bacterium]